MSTKKKRGWHEVGETTLYRAIFDVVAEGLLVADLESQQFLLANPEICRMLGYTREELLAMRAPEIHPGSRVRDAMAVFESQARGETTHASGIPFLRKDGSVIYADVAGTRVEIDGYPCLVGVFSDVTARVRAEEALRAAERRYEDLFAHMSSCVAVYEAEADGEDFRFVDFNKAAERAEHLTRDEMIGKSVLTLFPSVREFGLFDVFQRVWRTGRPESHPVTEYHDQRIHGWRENYVYKLPSGEIVAVYDDVTTQKQAEAALRKSEEEYRLLVENATEAVFVAQDGYLRLANPATGRILERTAADVAATPFAEILHPDDLGGVLEQHMRMLAGEDVDTEREFRILTGTGRVRWVQVKAVKVEWEGRPATLNLGSDITEKREAEERVERVLQETIRAVGRIAERRDPYTSGHQERVARLADAIAREMRLPDDAVAGLHVASLLHDIGKLGVPAEILSKPSVLTQLESLLVREHPQAAYDILKGIEFPWPTAEIVLQHHERLDGSGYPRGLRGGEIILEARILAVADAVEAMASHRPYRPALGIDAALAEIEAHRGDVYDSAVVDACLALFREGRFSFNE